DILKDRLYTSPPQSIERRSAQTVMYIILDSVVRIMAPILSFTAEEVWKFMPDIKEKESSVHLSSLPKANESWKNEKLAQKWEAIIRVRGEVTKALEEARAKKKIGHSLDAVVTISANKELYEELYAYEEDLRTIFIISGASLIKGEKLDKAYKSTDIEGLDILVEPASSDKCERCWIHDPSVSLNSERPTICSRCEKALGR
ncbi:MAG: class I tRNA ligase family protein, partial [Desulfobacterales bacterium]|nr:class I tRNA ligase family protein [Desulfobacterales bacterium]